MGLIKKSPCFFRLISKSFNLTLRGNSIMNTKIQKIKENFSLLDFCNKHLEKTPNCSKYQFVCPFCNSGKGANHTGAFTVNEKEKYYHCFSCGEHGDIINLFSKINGVDEAQARNDLYTYIGDDNVAQKSIELKIEQDTPDITAEIAIFQENRQNINQEVINYCNSRGFLVDDLMKYGISSYKWAKYSPSLQQNVDVECCMFPLVNANNKITNFYFRNLESDKHLRLTEFIKGAPRDVYAPSGFNSDVYIFCEGVFDALSIQKVVGDKANAIAFNSNSPKHDFIDTLNLQNKTVILALDNDKQGIDGALRTSDFLKGKAKEIHFFKYSHNDVKDPNEYFLKFPKDFALDIKSCIENLMIKSMDYFSDSIFNQKYEDPIKTGFDSLDQCLQGGLENGLYVIGALSSTGKSTLCLNIMDNLVERGTDCIYFSLEMSKLEHMRRSLVNLSYKLKAPLSIKEVMHDLRHDKAHIVDLYNAYCVCNEHRYIVDDVYNIEDIQDVVNNYTRVKGTKNTVIVVDYLQLIGSRKDFGSDKQRIDEVSKILKLLSAHFPIIVISSLNRNSYYETPSLDSLMESGTIEYTANVAMILTYEELLKCKQAQIKQTLEELREKEEKNMVLKVVKGRDVPSGFVANFSYYPKYYTFTSKSNDRVDEETNEYELIS